MDGEQKIINLLEKILERLDSIQSDSSYIESNTSEIITVVKQIKNK